VAFLQKFSVEFNSNFSGKEIYTKISTEILQKIGRVDVSWVQSDKEGYGYTCRTLTYIQKTEQTGAYKIFNYFFDS